MKKDKLISIGIIIGIIILSICALLTAYTDLPLEKFAITVSFWAFGYTLYRNDKNIFFTIAFLLMGCLNLISKPILLYDLSTVVIYLSGVCMLATLIKNKKD